MHAEMKFWDGIAAKYARAPIRDMDAYEQTLARVRTYLKPTDRVLELGCGTGTTALRLRDAVASILATDLSENMLEIGRAKAAEAGAGTVRFQQADARLEGIDGPFDVVTAFNLLHLVGDRAAMLVRAHELLPPGGLLITKTPCPTDQAAPLPVRLMLLALPLLQWLGKAPPVHFLSVADLETLIAAHGFEIVETGDYPKRPPSRFIVARRV